MEVKELNELSSEWQELVRSAVSIRGNAHAPYSKFKVGATLKVEGYDDGSFCGCNVENAAYTGSHAEEGAMSNMLRHRGLLPQQPLIEIIAVALEAKGDLRAVPCGGCRQKIREFGSPNTVILGVRLDGRGNVRDVECYTLWELLPFSFGPENLGK